MPFSDQRYFYHQAAQIAAQKGGVWTNQFENTTNALAHYSTTAPEVWNQLDGKVDAFVSASGSGGTIAGFSRFLKEKRADNEYSADTWLELCTKYLDNAFSAKERIEHGTREEKRDLILDLGQNLTLKGGKLDFRLKQPYDVLLLPEYRTNVLPD